VDTLPSLRERYAAVILRTAGPAGRDLVLLPRGAASGALLDAATRTLLHARATQGLRPAALHGRPFQTITLGVRYSEAPLEWALQNVPRAQGLVDRLLVAPPRAVPGVGVVPALVFYPPTPTSARGASQGGRASPGGPRR
jgi:hypothetical protein